MSEHKNLTPGAKRPMSAYTRGSNNSRLTNVPEVSKVRLNLMASDIFKSRSDITELLKSDHGNLRDNLSSSEIQSLLKRVGLFIEIGHVKALLKELGFNWNGKACSMKSLFQKCQEFGHGRRIP